MLLNEIEFESSNRIGHTRVTMKLTAKGVVSFRKCIFPILKREITIGKTWETKQSDETHFCYQFVVVNQIADDLQSCLIPHLFELPSRLN